MIGLGTALSVVGSLGGSFMQKEAQDDANKNNALLQHQFAKNAIQWKTKDAQKAGIHPLYALGANTATASPSFVSDSFGADVGNTMSNMGQNIANRELQKQQTMLNELQVENAIIQNKRARLQLNKEMDDYMGRHGNTQGLTLNDFPSYVGDAVKYLQFQHATGQYHPSDPNTAIAEKILEGKASPAEISEANFGDIGQEVHGANNLGVYGGSVMKVH
jgi:Fe-S cluster biosynthesis and repair protein YggX